MLDIINDILDVEKFSADKMTFFDEAVRLEYMMRKLVDPYKRLALRKNIEMNLLNSFSEDMHISVDVMKFEQVFNTLLSNALKFTDKGAISIEVKAIKEQERIRIVFSVKDTGIGISEAVKPHLFKPFTQANSEISKLHGGSGLGLTICKEIMHHYDGKIDFESSLGEGTNFYGYIYVLEVNQKSLISSDMDCQMPVMDGFEATKLIRKVQKNEDIRIIAMTAYASKEDKRCCLDAGMDDFISKPVDLDHLEATLDIGLKAEETHDEIVVIQSIGKGYNDSVESLIEKEIQRLMEYIHFDYETTSDLLHTFIKQMKTGIAEIEQQIIDEEFASASKKAHQLKGAAGAVRIEHLKNSVEKMEVALKVINVQDIKKCILLIKEDPLLLE